MAAGQHEALRGRRYRDRAPFPAPRSAPSSAFPAPAWPPAASCAWRRYQPSATNRMMPPIPLRPTRQHGAADQGQQDRPERPHAARQPCRIGPQEDGGRAKQHKQQCDQNDNCAYHFPPPRRSLSAWTAAPFPQTLFLRRNHGLLLDEEAAMRRLANAWPCRLRQILVAHEIQDVALPRRLQAPARGKHGGPDKPALEQASTPSYSKPRSASSRRSFGGISISPALPLPRSAGASDGLQVAPALEGAARLPVGAHDLRDRAPDGSGRCPHRR